MQLASCTVCLTKDNHVPKPSVTPAEVAILRKIHSKNFGGDPVIDVKIHTEDWKNYNPQVEIARLRAKYGGNAKGHTWFDEAFPGASNNPSIIPDTFDKVKWIPTHVATNNEAPSQVKLPGEPGYEEPVKAEALVPQQIPKEQLTPSDV